MAEVENLVLLVIEGDETVNWINVFAGATIDSKPIVTYQARMRVLSLLRFWHQHLRMERNYCYNIWFELLCWFATRGYVVRCSSEPPSHDVAVRAGGGRTIKPGMCFALAWTFQRFDLLQIFCCFVNPFGVFSNWIIVTPCMPSWLHRYISLAEGSLNSFSSHLIMQLPSVNSLMAVHLWNERAVMFAELLGIQKRLGSERFPVIESTFYVRCAWSSS